MPNADSTQSLIKSSEDKYLGVTLFSEAPLTFLGGGERLIKLLYNYCLALNIHVKIVENTKQRDSSQQSIQHTNMNVIKTEFKRFGLIKFLQQDFPSLELIPSSDNGVSLIFLRRVPPRSVLLKLAQSNSKVIFCLHGIALEKLRITNPIIIAHQLLIRSNLRNLARFTRNFIFVQSVLPSITSYLGNRGADLKNVFTIENEFESDVEFPIRNDDDFQVTFIGRMDDLQKGIKRLRNVIKIIGKYDYKIRFNVIGTGKDIEILKTLGDGVSIYYGIDDDSKNKIISMSNLAIVTSNLEPFSIVIQEFLTSGVPVITTPTSGPSYILSKDLSFGNVASFNPKSLAVSIIKYYNEWNNDKDLYFTRRKILYVKARTRFKSINMLESYKKMMIQISLMK